MLFTRAVTWTSSSARALTPPWSCATLLQMAVTLPQRGGPIYSSATLPAASPAHQHHLSLTRIKSPPVCPAPDSFCDCRVSPWYYRSYVALPGSFTIEPGRQMVEGRHISQSRPAMCLQKYPRSQPHMVFFVYEHFSFIISLAPKAKLNASQIHLHGN